MRGIATIIFSMIALVGCFDADIHSTEHPDSAELHIAVDLPDGGGDYTIVIGGVEYEVVDGVASLPDYFDAGVYNAYVFNSTDNVTLDCTADGAIASVAEGLDPGMLYFGKQQFNVVGDEVISSTMSVEQVTAQIDFELTLAGSAAEGLSGLTTRLDGIAAKWDCVNSCSCESGYAEPTLSYDDLVVSYSRSDNYVVNVILTGSMTLLGVADDEQQILSITLTYGVGDSETTSAPIAVDISSQLSTLNQNKTTPIKLSGEYETPLDVGVEGGVIDWVVVDESGNDDIIDIY